MLNIIKRDGSSEPFDPQKIAAVLQAAGLEQDQTKQVIGNVTAWATSLNKNTLTSLEIRDQVEQQLETINPYVAGLFKWYQKTKDASINV